MIDPLSRLAVLHGTDKFGYHDYTPHYFGLLEHLRDQPVKMLEIGVGGYGFEDRGGESLATWRDFFPSGQITGLDIQPKTMDLGPRVRIVQGSQVDPDCLSALVAERGPFDIILDDGSHRNEHVVESFGLLFPTLKPGGIYIVEDVQTAFFPRFGGSLTLDAPNSVGMAVTLMQQLAKGRGGDVGVVERFHNIFVVHKAGGDGTRALSQDDRRIRAAGRRPYPVAQIAADAITDMAGLSDAVDDLVGADRLGEGALLLRGLPQDHRWLTDVFVGIDHNEIRLHHPTATLPRVLQRIAGMAVYGDGVVFQIGDNDYPSNFAYDPSHPRTAAAIAAMGEVLQDPAATANGLMQYAAILSRFQGREAAFPLLDRLAELGCQDERYVLLAAQRLKQAENWPALESMTREALLRLPDNPHLLSLLTTSLRKMGRADEALPILRAAQARAPRERAIVPVLANLEIASGNPDRAVALMEKAIVLFPVSDRPARLRKLIEICRIAKDDAAAQRAAQRLQLAVPDDPLAAEVLGQAAS